MTTDVKADKADIGDGTNGKVEHLSTAARVEAGTGRTRGGAARIACDVGAATTTS